MSTKHLKYIGILLAVAVLLYLPRLFGGGEDGGSVSVDSGFSFELADPVTRVDVIRLDSGDTIRLDRSGTEWTVDGYRVDDVKVEDLLGVLSTLSSDEIVARNPANHRDLGVSTDTGRRIEVYTEAGGPLAFHLGARDPAAGGYFVRLPGTDEVFRLEGPAGGYLSRDRDGWRDRTIASVDTAGVREIVLRRPEDEMVLRRTDEAWRVDGGPADSATVQSLLQSLVSLGATGFASDEEMARLDFGSAEHEIDVFAADGGDVTGRRLVLSLRFIIDEEGGDWLVRHADGSEVYRLRPYVARRLVPEREALTPAGEAGSG